jgi:hypothetical protein
MLQPIAAERGFSFADPYVIGLLFCALRGVGDRLRDRLDRRARGHGDLPQPALAAARGALGL